MRRPDLGNFSPCVYVSGEGDIHTTGVFVTADDDRNLHEQMKHEIAKFVAEKVEDIAIVRQIDHWTVHVPQRFTPVGRIYAIAMLDPEWRP